MRWLTSRLKTLSKESPARSISRNLLLHAIPASFNAETQTLVLHHMQMVGTDIHSRHINVPMEQLKHFTEAIQLVNQFLGTITKELFTPEGYARLQTRG